MKALWQFDQTNPPSNKPLTLSGQRARVPYIRILKHFGFVPEVRGPWAIIGATEIVQGWKIHVSSIPVQAVALLKSVLPTLQRYSISFKTAKDSEILESLNEGSLGATQSGKFMTIYPGSDTLALALARDLLECTKGFEGPRIITDLRLGDVVYTRYGAFNPIINKNRLGQFALLIHGADGSLRTDEYAVPFKLPEGISNPFGELAAASAGSEAAAAASDAQPPSGKLFGPGYLILEVIKAHTKGSVFAALDLRDQAHTSAKIIKQGRQHLFSDVEGRDMRSRLARQRVLHGELGSCLMLPKADCYFEIRGDGYLVLEYVQGKTLDNLVSRSLAGASWRTLTIQRMTELLSGIDRLISAVHDLHQAGFVHRDLTPSNILVGDKGEVYLLDLELTHKISDSAPPLHLGTIGFMSPQQQTRHAPSLSDDIYALGSILIFVLTGLDPSRVLFASGRSRRQQLEFLGRGAPPSIIAMAAQCVRRTASFRPDLPTLAEAVRRDPRPHGEQPVGFDGVGELANIFRIAKLKQRARRLVINGEKGILADSVRDETTGLWLSPTYDDIDAAAGRRRTATYELHPDAHRGVAGVLYLLARLSRFKLLSSAGKKQARSAATWLLQRKPDTSDLPGLYFGGAGIGVALAEAVAGRLVVYNDEVDSAIRRALQGRLDWPDITHGAAGQGVAALYCADRLHDASMLRFAHRCARYLLETQVGDGSWKMPAGVEGMSDQTLTGFAHGVAGVLYFLAEHAFRFDDSSSRKAWNKGLDWLARQSIPIRDGMALGWRYSDIDDERWKWWCHGSPGIALALLRSYERGGNPEHAILATKALNVYPVDVLDTRLSQCHGLSGIGEIYLEAARVLGDTAWLRRAAWIMQLLNHLCRQRSSGSASWLVEDSYSPTADLMVGFGGVVHFLLRFSEGSTAMGFPMLLDPVSGTFW